MGTRRMSIIKSASAVAAFENINSYSFNASSSKVVHGAITNPQNLTVLLWAKPANLTSGLCFASQWSASTNERSWVVQQASTGICSVLISGSGSAVQKNYSTAAAAVSTSAWNMFGFVYTGGGTDTLTLVKTAGFEGTPTKTTDNAVTGGQILVSTVPFCQGIVYRNSGGSEAAFYDGLQTHVSIWNAALTEAECLATLSGGAPIDLTSHSKYANLIHWFQDGNLNDTTSSCLDRRGSNNGTGADITISSDNP